MLTPSAVGAYFDSFSSSCSRTWRKRVSSPTAIIGSCRAVPADRVRAQQRARSVSTVSSTAATTSNGARDSPVRPSPRTEARIESTRPVEPRQLVDRRVAPGLGRRRSAASAVPGGLAEQVDVDPDDRQRRPQFVGDDAQQLGAGGVEGGQLGQPRLDLGREAALLDDARRAAPRSCCRKAISSVAEAPRRRASGR